MAIKKVVVLGSGVLGSQIAYQVAFSGYDVTIWLRSEGSIERAKPKLQDLKTVYEKEIKLMASDKSNFNNWCLGISDYETFDEEELLKKNEKVLDSIKIELSLERALKNCDLIIESTKEDLNDKKELYNKVNKYIEDKTILVTNSSTLLPSKLAKSVKNNERFLSLHFANNIWKCNTAEVMAHKNTNMDCFNEVIEFANSIRMVALPLYKEKSGYLLNSMLIPLLFSALDMLAHDISDFESIDKAWKVGTGAPKGPFEILDIVGLKTAYNIAKMYAKIPSIFSPYDFKGVAKLLEKYVNEGKTGIEVKEGFYKYN